MTAVEPTGGPELGALSFIDPFDLEKTSEPGRSRAEISEGWGSPIHPNGGIVSAVAIGTMTLELGVPEHALRTSTTMSSSIVTARPVRVDVAMIRRGKRMSPLRATIRNQASDQPGHQRMAAFGEARAGLDVPGVPAPEGGEPKAYLPVPPPPDKIPAFRAGFFQRIDSRRVKMLKGWEEGWEGGTAAEPNSGWRSSPRAARDGRAMAMRPRRSISRISIGGWWRTRPN